MLNKDFIVKRNNSPKLEIACFNLRSALIAHQNMADRVELCKDFKDGGVTPDYETVTSALTKISVDIFVMIRPREGDFVYSKEEFEQMNKDIVHFKKMGVNGFVFAILNNKNGVDVIRNKELVKLASPLPCTFHRAFDKTDNPIKALEDVIKCGFKTLLTSGGRATAVEGINLLADLVTKADGRIVILPGGGVRSSNIAQLKEKIKTTYFHSSAITDSSEVANVNEIQLLKKKLSM